jgi:glycosyltransferase involved in cell wall biosynthesis
VARLGVERWLTTRTADHVPVPAGLSTRVEAAPRGITAEDVRAWVRGLDWVVFAENPVVPGLVWRAREMGAGVACVPMWEWTDPAADWLAGVDLMICPTVHTFERMLALKRSHGFTWDLTHVPWPVDLARFSFHPRGVCRRFLYVNGRGGCLGRRPDGSPTPYRRKGLDVVVEAAARLKGVPFLVRSQVPVAGPLPPNVKVLPPLGRNERLYDDGDVCVQPSRWEGIGLSLLECQAAGLPLVTTDAPPMNEFAPLRAVRAQRVETVYLEGDHPVPAHLVDPGHLAETLGALVGTDLSAASRSARAFVERFHGWGQAARLLNESLLVAPLWR